MRGVISFHPVDPGFFETLIDPLLRGEKINPETYLASACRLRRAARLTRGYKLALELLLEELEPPPPPEQGSMWDKMRSKLESYDYRAPALARLVASKVEPNVELQGRPFLIAEGSTDRVAQRVAEYTEVDGENALQELVRGQLKRVDPAVAKQLEPVWVEEPCSDPMYRQELLGELKRIYDARDRPAAEMPWKIIWLHSRAVPFWIARDVDGLETICTAAGVDPPACMTTAAVLFAGASAEFPQLSQGPLELAGQRDLGAYVTPAGIPELLEFLGDHGAKIIQVATRHGEGPLCRNLLRKIRECVRFADEYGVGYLEVSGIHPLLEEPAELGAAV